MQLNDTDVAAFRAEMTAPNPPIAQAAAAVSALQSKVFAVAQQDPEHGLALFDGLLAMCSGIVGLESTSASLGYNRAAHFRKMEQFDAAAAGYQSVVDEFESSPDPEVLFWVGMALYNHLTMELASPDEIAAERIPILAGKLRDLCADHEDPRIVARVRIAMCAEMELFQRLDRADQAATARERFVELLRPDIEHVVAALDDHDPMASADDAAPKWSIPRDQLVTALLISFEPTLDVVRGLADGDVAALAGAISQFPILLSRAALVALAAARDRHIAGAQSDEDSERIGRGLRLLLSVYENFRQHPHTYPVGSGPIESLLNAVDVTISMTDAMTRVRAVDLVGALSIHYVNMLGETSMQLIDDDWRRAFRWHNLLLTAAERAANSLEGRAMVARARFRWLFVARQVLNHLPDGRVLHSAADAGRRALEFYRSESDRAMRAEVLLALSSLYSEPYSVGRVTTNVEANLRRWRDRLAEEVLDPVEVPDDVSVVMPDFAEAVDISEAYAREAMEFAVPVQRIHLLSGLIELLRARSLLGQEIDHAELADIADQLAAADDVDSYPGLLANALVAQTALGHPPDETTLARLFSRPIDEIAEQSGSHAATGVLLAASQIFADSDPARGRRLFAQAQGFVRSLPERTRFTLLSLQLKLFAATDDLVIDAESVPRESLATVLERATNEGWSAERAATALITWFSLGHDSADSLEDVNSWAPAIGALFEHYPAFAEDHRDLLLYTAAGSWTRVATRAWERHDLAGALASHTIALEQYLDLSAPDAAMESLTLLARIVEQAEGTGLAQVAAGSLGGIVVRAENMIGAAATDVLQTIWSRVIGSAAEDTDELDAMFACMQLAKGARFVHALRAGVAFDARTHDEASALLSSVEPRADVIDTDLDAVTLVTPHTERFDVVGEVTGATQRENLERTFDALVQREITGRELGYPTLMDLDTVCGLLPPDAVLLFTYLCHSPLGGQTILTVVLTRDQVTVVPNHVLIPGPAVVEARFENRVRTVDWLAGTVLGMRQAVQAEPGPSRVIARAGKAALDDCLELFGPVADLLRDEHASGRRHLMIVPHGPLHFAPLHLLPVDGKPLAEAWTVTYLPNLALLATPPPLADDKTAAAAVGLGFADGTLPPIPEAVEEATAVAAKLGIHPLVDAEATETAVLDALANARTFHIATHGAHNVAAPAFQRLYVADEEISAHELLRLDLRGLDLITLSACETALGRFDVADNLRGIPANLLLRGARTVVGTLWPVESHTSSDFFTTLYEMLHEGRSKLAAYTDALRQTRLDHPEYRDWGAFYYVGDWR